MNRIVKFLKDDDGEEVPKYLQYWHLVSPINAGGSASFCTNEYFGYGESSVVYIEKEGKVTCPECKLNVAIIKKIIL